MHRQQWPSWAIFSLLVVQLLGCGPTGPQREYAEVSGTITYQGKPLEMGTVMFQPPYGAFAMGEIQADGTYSLQGAVGENTVTITCRDPIDHAALLDPANRPDPKKPPQRPQSHIPEIYAAPQGGLKFHVEPGSNTADFDLK